MELQRTTVRPSVPAAHTHARRFRLHCRTHESITRNQQQSENVERNKSKRISCADGKNKSSCVFFFFYFVFFRFANTVRWPAVSFSIVQVCMCGYTGARIGVTRVSASNENENREKIATFSIRFIATMNVHNVKVNVSHSRSVGG